MDNRYETAVQILCSLIRRADLDPTDETLATVALLHADQLRRHVRPTRTQH